MGCGASGETVVQGDANIGSPASQPSRSSTTTKDGSAIETTLVRRASERQLNSFNQADSEDPGGGSIHFENGMQIDRVKVVRGPTTRPATTTWEGQLFVADAQLEPLTPLERRRSAAPDKFSSPEGHRVIIKDFNFSVPPLAAKLEAVPDLIDALCQDLCTLQKVSSDYISRPLCVFSADESQQPQGGPLKVISIVNERYSHGVATPLMGMLSGDQLHLFLHSIASALWCLHSHGLVHRRVIPENVAVAPDSFVLLDAGLGSLVVNETAASLYAAGQRQCGLFPPELVKKSPLPLKEKSDVWALGALAFWARYGREPFRGGTEAVLFHSVVEDPVQFPPSTAESAAQDDEFFDFVRAALRKDPEKRASAIQLMRLPYMRRKSVAGFAGANQSASGSLPSSTPGAANLTAASVNGYGPETEVFLVSVTPHEKTLSKPVLPTGLSLGGGSGISPSSPSGQEGGASTGGEHLLLIVEDAMSCSRCAMQLVSIGFRCLICDPMFVLCSTCFYSEDHGPHDVNHPFESLAITSGDERRVSMAFGSLSQVQRHKSLSMAHHASVSRQSSASPTPQHTTLPLEVVIDDASTDDRRVSSSAADPRFSVNMAKSVATMVVSTATLTEHERTLFSMTGTLPGKLEAVKQLERQSSNRARVERGLGGKMLDCPHVNDLILECKQSMTAELLLYDLHLTSVPASLWNPPLVQLTTLDVSCNELTELPHEIAFLTQLVRLIVSNNKLRCLPDALGDLPSLEHLDANNNQLSELPQSLMFLDRLETLILDYNNFSAIPGVVLDMSNLAIVYLVANYHIREWPALDDLKHLGALNMGLDNHPGLTDGFDAVQAAAPQLTVTWNKIYPDRVCPYVFCGSVRSAQNSHVYEALDIKYVLTVGRGLNPYVAEGMERRIIIVDDIEGASMEPHFLSGAEFIAQAVAEKKGVLIHCFAGLSRSATMVICYLMLKAGMRLDTAYNLTKKGRPAIYPNHGFFNQLLALDAKLFPGQRPLDIVSMQREKVPL